MQRLPQVFLERVRRDILKSCHYPHASPQDILSLARRSRRTIWINPEIPSLWGTGDSDMLRYAPVCDNVMIASTLAQLTAAIDKLLV